MSKNKKLFKSTKKLSAALINKRKISLLNIQKCLQVHKIN